MKGGGQSRKLWASEGEREAPKEEMRRTETERDWGERERDPEKYLGGGKRLSEVYRRVERECEGLGEGERL